MRFNKDKVRLLKCIEARWKGDRQTNRRADRWMDRQTDRQTDVWCFLSPHTCHYQDQRDPIPLYFPENAAEASQEFFISNLPRLLVREIFLIEMQVLKKNYNYV